MAIEDLEIREPGEYNHGKEEVYSHSTLVMKALKECQNKRSVEMRDGYFNIKFDRMGNAHRVWMPDSRSEFIESVESLMMIQDRDYDDEVVDQIKKLKEALQKKYLEYCEKEKKEWEIMHHEKKQELFKKGSYHRENLLSEDLPYKYEFLRDKVFIYTKIVAEIQKSIKRTGDYQEEIWEG